MKEYRILKETYYDQYGEEKNSQYFIQTRKKFLGIRYWSSISHDVGSMSGTFSTTTYFSSVKQAEEFAEKHICGGRCYDGWVTKVVTTKQCN
jgi:hypothetical protein